MKEKRNGILKRAGDTMSRMFSGEPRKSAFSRSGGATSFDGARTSDRLPGMLWSNSTRSINSILDQELVHLWDHVDDLYRNDSYAASAVNGRVNNVVGRGYGLQARVSPDSVLVPEGAIDRELANEINKIIEARWNLACKSPGVSSGYKEVMRLAQRSKALYGESIIHYVISDNEWQPVKLEVIHPRRLADPTGSYVYRNGERVQLTPDEQKNTRMGVRRDPLTGEVLAYYIQTSEVDDTKDMTYMFAEVAAEDIIHSFEAKWPGQVRGIPWMAPVVNELKDIKDFAEANLVSEQVSACFSAFIKKSNSTPYDEAVANSVDEDSDTGMRIEELEPGMVQYLSSDEDVVFTNPNKPGATLGPYMEWRLRNIASGLDYPYELLAKDYSRTTYSSGRLSLIDGRNTFQVWQQDDIREIWSRVYSRFVEALVLHDALPISALQYNELKLAVLEHEFVPEGWDWIDPVKDVRASNDSIEGGINTKSDILASQGRDYETVLATRTRERLLEVEADAQVALRRKELEDEYGITLGDAPSEDVTTLEGETSETSNSNEDKQYE